MLEVWCVAARGLGGSTDMTAHTHNFWLFYLCEDKDGVHKVWEDPFYPTPEHFDHGYECACGAKPEGR